MAIGVTTEVVQRMQLVAKITDCLSAFQQFHVNVPVSPDWGQVQLLTEMLLENVKWLRERDNWMDPSVWDEMEVIGNIHENPELLGTK